MTGSALITGIDGFTGRYMARALANQGFEVHGIVRTRSEHAIDGAHSIYECDILDLEGISAIVSRVRPEKVVHLAAVAFVAHANVNEMYLTNIVGTRTLLEACAQSGQMPSSVLIASSANIYGSSASGVISESAPICPANDYGVSKVATENLAQIYSSRLPLLIVRPFNYTGVGQSELFAVAKFVAHVARREGSIEVGNLDVSRDISDIRMVIDAYCRLLKTPAAIGQTLNICSGQAYSLRSILELAMEIAGHTMDIRVNPAFLRANDVPFLCGSKDKLESIIGPLNVRPLEDTLSWMLQTNPCM